MTQASNFSKLVYIVLLISLSSLSAQVISSKVTLQADRLLPQERELLQEIPPQLENYINSHEWSNSYQKIVIDMRVNFVIETVTQRGSEQVFRGRLVVNSPSGENFLDRGIEFPYQRGQGFQHQRSLFDPLLSVVDYYVYMVMAGELDAYLLKAGTLFYEKAKTLADQGQVSNYSIGWRSRLEEVQLITDGDHDPLRETKFYYYEGLFYIEQYQDENKGREMASKVTELLERVYRRKPNSSALKRFFDSHYQEFCGLFVYDLDRSNRDMMMRIDNRRSEIYDACGQSE